MKVLILGTGDQAVVLTHALRALDVQVVGYVGRKPGRIDSALHQPGDAADLDVLRTVSQRLGVVDCAIGFGDNGMRAEAGRAARQAGMSLMTVVHPRAFVDPSAQIGAGSFVGPHAVVNLLARVGEGALINTGALVDHDCVIGDYACVYTGATLAGMVCVEDLVMVGLGAKVLQGRTVGRAAVVGAGAVVVEDVEPLVVVTGVPARVTRQRREDEPYL